MVGGGAFFDQAPGCVADELGAQGLVLRFTAGKACGKVARAGVVGYCNGPAVGVVFHRDALAAHAGFFDHAVGRVVLEAEVLAVFVDEGAKAPCCVVAQLDVHNNWTVSLAPACNILIIRYSLKTERLGNT